MTDLARQQDFARLRETLEWVRRESPFYRERLAGAGLLMIPGGRGIARQEQDKGQMLSEPGLFCSRFSHKRKA